jgi:DNA-binding GntR family transcriptional regulator
MASQTNSTGRRVLREEIKEHLIEEIVSGRLKPGDRIVEMRVAQDLGVSQAPVREALRDLELFGFIVSLPYRGAQVREVSIADLVQIYPIRAALEGVAGRFAVGRIDQETLQRLEHLLEKMRDSSVRNDHHAHVEADVEFHKTIIEASGNELIKRFWESMRLETTTFLTMAMSRRSLQELAERHVVLLETLRSGDPLLVETAMRRHIEEPGEWILEHAKQHADENDVTSQ